MKLIALSILSVGLCFYEAYRLKHDLGIDPVAILVSFISALIVILTNETN